MLEKRAHHARPAVEARRTPPLNVDLGNLLIEVRPVASLQPYARNPRTHSAKQIRQIATSIRQFGFTNPILVDRDGGVVAGHGRLEAARLLGMQEVPTIRLDRMTEAQKRAYIIADNKLAQSAAWDRELLAVEFQYLSNIDVDFDLTITGFEAAEIAVLLPETRPRGVQDIAEHVRTIDNDVTPISRPGELWILGQHRMLCGDPTAAESFHRLMGDSRADMVFVDLLCEPWLDRHGARGGPYPDFSKFLGAKSEHELIAFFRRILGYLTSHSIDGSLHLVCTDRLYCFELLSAGRQVYTGLADLRVWNTCKAGSGSLWHSANDLIFVFSNETGSRIKSRKSARHARSRTNRLGHPNTNMQRDGVLEEKSRPAGAMPVAFVEDAIVDCSKRGGVVLDCFAGSGTTLMAAEKSGRRAYLMELDRACVDLAVRRFEKVTGKKAVNAETGRSFTELEQERSGKPPVSGEAEDGEGANAR